MRGGDLARVALGLGLAFVSTFSCKTPRQREASDSMTRGVVDKSSQGDASNANDLGRGYRLCSDDAGEWMCLESANDGAVKWVAARHGDAESQYFTGSFAYPAARRHFAGGEILAHITMSQRGALPEPFAGTMHSPAGTASENQEYMVKLGSRLDRSGIGAYYQMQDGRWLSFDPGFYTQGIPEGHALAREDDLQPYVRFKRLSLSQPSRASEDEALDVSRFLIGMDSGECIYKSDRANQGVQLDHPRPSKDGSLDEDYARSCAVFQLFYLGEALSVAIPQAPSQEVAQTSGASTRGGDAGEVDDPKALEACWFVMQPPGVGGAVMKRDMALTKAECERQTKSGADLFCEFDTNYCFESAERRCMLLARFSGGTRNIAFCVNDEAKFVGSRALASCEKQGETYTVTKIKSCSLEESCMGSQLSADCLPLPETPAQLVGGSYCKAAGRIACLGDKDGKTWACMPRLADSAVGYMVNCERCEEIDGRLQVSTCTDLRDDYFSVYGYSIHAPE